MEESFCDIGFAVANTVWRFAAYTPKDLIERKMARGIRTCKLRCQNPSVVRQISLITSLLKRRLNRGLNIGMAAMPVMSHRVL